MRAGLFEDTIPVDWLSSENPDALGRRVTLFRLDA